MIDHARHPFQILAEIARAARHTTDLEDFLQRIVAAATDTCHARGGTLRVLQLPEDELRLRAAAGLSSRYLAKGKVTVQRPLRQIYAEGPLIIHDIQTDARIQHHDAAVQEGIATIVELPFAVLPDCHMVLRLHFRDRITPVSEDVAFLTALGEQGAQAIRNQLVPDRYLKAFQNVSQAVHRGNDTTGILQGIVRQITELLAAAGCIFWIVDLDALRIEAKISHGFSYRSLAAVDCAALLRIFDASPGGVVLIEDAAADDRIPDLQRLGKQHVRTVAGLTFGIDDRIRGILAVYFSAPRRLTRQDMDLLKVLGEQGAISLHRSRRYDENMLDTFRRTVEGLVTALEAKDPVTHGHSLNVGTYARLTALEMGLTPGAAEKLYHAGLLHDIGKIGMTDKILARLGRLSAKEMGEVRLHPVIGARILAPLVFLDDLIPMIRYHHERYDGSGYPDGLREDAIPIGARILAACDALETMLAGRPHMPRHRPADALAMLRDGAGSRFDPEVVRALAAAVSKGPAGPPEDGLFSDDQDAATPLKLFPLGF